MKNFWIRTWSGILLAAVVLWAILWTQWSFGVLLLLLLIVGMAEFYALAEKQGNAPQRFLGLVAGVVLFALNFAFVCDDIQILGSGSHAFGSGMAFMLLYFPIIASDAWNPWVMLFYVFIIWANDVFAYLVGMTLGRHRLCERLSPKKSWEGFFGGIVGAVATGFVAARVFGADQAAWAGLAFVASITGVLGDLVESMFKRAAGVGGVLDRFDAMLLSAPFVFVYMLFVM